jgi:WD40 repeat protein
MIIRVTLENSGERFWGVAFSPDRAFVAAASADGTARLVDVASGTERAQLAKHDGGMRSVAFSPDGSLLATTGDDGIAQLLDVPSGNLRQTFHGHHDSVFRGVFSADGSLLATAGRDGTARIWDAASGRLRRTIRVHEPAAVWDLAFSPDGAVIATASSSPESMIKLWAVESGEELASFFGLAESSSAALFPDGSYALYGDPGDDLWWAIKLCRFAPGELDPYVPGLRNRLKDE